jgi:hypothetical protein
MVEKVAVLIIDSSGCMVERYVIDMKARATHPLFSSFCPRMATEPTPCFRVHMPHPISTAVHAGLSCSVACPRRSGPALAQAYSLSLCMQMQPEILQSVDLEDLESALRSCLLKLQYADAALAPLTKGALPTCKSPLLLPNGSLPEPACILVCTWHEEQYPPQSHTRPLR